MQEEITYDAIRIDHEYKSVCVGVCTENVCPLHITMRCGCDRHRRENKRVKPRQMRVTNIVDAGASIYRLSDDNCVF